MPRRRRGSPSLLLIVLLIVVLVPLLAVGGVYAFVDPNSFKPRIAEAVHAATGRDLSLRGPLSIAISLTPTLRADDVGLANPTGFSRPEIATLGRVEAQLSLWPLLRGRIEIVRLLLIKPDLMLETDANGQGNWRIDVPTTPSGAPVATTSGNATVPGTPRFAVATVRMQGGRIGWHDGATGATRVLDIGSFEATETDPSAPISATADVSMDGHAATVNAELGSFVRLLARNGSPDATLPWPMQLVVRTEGARLAATGTVAQPMDGKGYALTLDASLPDLAPIGQLIGRPLPALHDVFASAKVSDATGMPLLTGLMARAGASDLQASVPRLTLDRLEISAPSIDQPIHAEVDGALAGTKLSAAADIGAIATLLPGFQAGAAKSAAPFPVNISAQAAGATLTAKGGIASPGTLTGLDVAVSARVPDLAALSPLVGRPLPGLRNVAFDGRLSDSEGGYTKGVVLRDATMTLPQADLAADLTLGFGPRLSLQGQISGKRIDLDSLQAAFPSPAPSSPATPPASATAAPPARGSDRLFSDTPFNLSRLDALDADLKLAAGEVVSGGISYRDLAGHVVLNQRHLTLDPLAATLPGGRLEGRLSLDASVAEPPAALTLSAPGIALKPLLTAFGLPDDVTGTVELNADLTAAGTSPHALAASLSGRLGVAMGAGDLDNRLLGSLGNVLRVARLPAELLGGGGGGRTRIRCFALRMDATHGMGTIAAMVLDTPRALVQGGGGINLTDETLGLRLRPMIRTGGPGVVVPVRVTGRIENPNVAVDTGGAIEGFAGGLVGGVVGGVTGLAKNPLGTLLSAVTGERGGDACGPALAAARAARPGSK